MTTAARPTTAKRDAALRLTDLGYAVVRAHSVDAFGACTCVLRQNCPKPGKHPSVPGGFNAATRDRDTIRRWWREQPDANLYVNLELSGVVDIAPDGLEARDDFHRRGLPATTAYRSGGGPGHEHHWYRATDDTPHVRINRSGAYDLQSAGGSVVPPSDHASGRTYAWIREPVPVAQLELVPAWAVAMLKERAAEIAAHKAGTGAGPATADPNPDGEVDLEPPVVLDADDLAVWRGAAPKRKPDGTIDTSATLLKIGRALYDNNATRRTIVAALAERDITLGYRKYTDRKDAAAQYHAVVNELERGGHFARAIVDDDPPANLDPQHDACRQRFTAYQCLVNTLHEENRQLQAQMTAEAAVRRADCFTIGERETGITAIKHVVSAAKREAVRPDGWIPVNCTAVGHDTGQSPQTASKHIKRLAAAGFLETRTVPAFIDVQNLQTGRIERQRVSEVQVRAGWADAPSVVEPLHQLAGVTPDKQATWGGRRTKGCPHHPDAGIRRAWVDYCAVCHAEIARSRPDPDMGYQDEPPSPPHHGGGSTPHQDERPSPDRCCRRCGQALEDAGECPDCMPAGGWPCLGRCGRAWEDPGAARGYWCWSCQARRPDIPPAFSAAWPDAAGDGGDG